MRRNVINVVLGVFVSVAFGLTGCGSGGGSSTTTSSNSGGGVAKNTVQNWHGSDYPLRMTLNKDSNSKFIATGSSFDFHKNVNTGLACTYNGDSACQGVAGSITAVNYNGTTITLTGDYSMIFTGTYSSGVLSGTYAMGSSTGAFSVDIP